MADHWSGFKSQRFFGHTIDGGDCAFTVDADYAIADIVQHDTKPVLAFLLGQVIDGLDLKKTFNIPEYFQQLGFLGFARDIFQLKVDMGLVIGTDHFHGNDIESVAGNARRNISHNSDAVPETKFEFGVHGFPFQSVVAPSTSAGRPHIGRG